MPMVETRLEKLQVLKLLQSVRAEDRTQIEKLATHGIPDLINYSEPEKGETALHIAACKNNEDMMIFLLDMGANPNVVDGKGATAAMKAAEYGHIQSLKILAEAHSDMTVRDKEGKGILFYCLLSTKRHTESLRIALEHGANVNNVSNEGVPLLITAAETGLEEFVDELLHAGADPNSKNLTTSFSASHAAAMSGCVECLRAILEAGADVNALDDKDNHAAHLAADRGHYDVIRLLASHGADLNLSNKNGDTALHIAATKGFGPICKYLAQRGCSSLKKNNAGKLARILAKENENKEALKECKKAEKSEAKGRGSKPGTEPWAIRLYDWLLENQEKVLDLFYKFDNENEDGSRTGKLSKDNITTCLLTLGAPIEQEQLKKVVEAHDPNRTNIVDYTIFLSGKKFVNKLYLVGAVKKKKKKGGKKGKRKKGKTKIPLPICTAPDGPRAKNGGPPSQYIEKYVPFTDETRFDRDNPPKHPIEDDSAWYMHQPDPTYINLSDAVKFGDLNSVKAALNNGLCINQRDKYYKTPLMVACAYGNIKVVQVLLELGADLKARDNFLWTPLHHACHSGQLDVVQLLIEKGADMDTPAINGGTPLMRAVESSSEAVVSFMILKGAKVQVENRKGHTALDIAKAYADPRVVAIVKKRWDEIPPPVDKKKKRGSSTKNKKRNIKSAGDKQNHNQTPASADSEHKLDSGLSDLPPLLQKSSVLRAASALGIVGEKPRSIAFTPHKAWVPQATTEDLLRERETRRLRFGYEIDFPEYKPPFQKNIYDQAMVIEKEES